jgi:lysophospholipid acyltransferase (LPLAT)-like uncharacterized protein
LDLSVPTFRDYFWTNGEPWRSVRHWIVPRLLRAAHSVLVCTLRLTTSGIAETWPHRPKDTGVLLVVWHDLKLLMLHFARNQDIGVMVSHSRAGQIVAPVWELYGFPAVYGSKNKREGIQAIREGLRLLRAGRTFAFTPDGPTGPRHQAHSGVVYLASTTPTAVIPMGVAVSSGWCLPTWDRFLIPKPFARVHIHMGQPLHVPPNLPRDETAYWQDRITAILNEASDEAERRLKAGRKGKE